MSTPPTRVLLVASSAGDYGGLDSFVFRLAKLIDSADDFEVKVCLKRIPSFELGQSLADALERATFPVFFVARASRGLFKAIREADVVHSQTQSIDIVVIAKLLRTPQVMTFHTTREVAPRLREWIASRLPERRLYNSDFTWRTWEPRGRRRGSEKFPYFSELPTGVVEPGERRGFVFIARWAEGKGVEVLVDAYDRAEIDRQRWPLMLVGDGPLRPQIEKEVRQRRLDTVDMPGFLAGEERAAAIRGAKWMVVPPNWNEPFGFTPVEARHVGVPCIVTRDGGLPEAAGTLSLSCEPGDAGQLARLLEFAAAMDERTYEWLAAASQRELLAGMRSMDEYLDLYREMARH